ncbi:hypothetical protein HK101_006774, partial [Irineochytrium annulatum]
MINAADSLAALKVDTADLIDDLVHAVARAGKAALVGDLTMLLFHAEKHTRANLPQRETTCRRFVEYWPEKLQGDIKALLDVDVDTPKSDIVGAVWDHFADGGPGDRELFGRGWAAVNGAARRHELMVKERMRRMRGTGTGSASGKRGYEDDEVVAVRGVGSRKRVKN